MTVHRVYADFPDAEQAERVRKWFGGFLGIDDLAKMEKREPCTWTEDADTDWYMDCGAVDRVVGSTEGMHFCYNCGRPVLEKPYQKEGER